jgi:hypothetical protein
VLYQELNTPSAVEVSCTLILFHFVHLCPHLSWEIVGPFGSQQVSISY